MTKKKSAFFSLSIFSFFFFFGDNFFYIIILHKCTDTRIPSTNKTVRSYEIYITSLNLEIARLKETQACNEEGIAQGYNGVWHLHDFLFLRSIYSPHKCRKRNANRNVTEAVYIWLHQLIRYH